MAAISFEHADDARTALSAIVSDPAHGADALYNPQIMSNLLQDLLPDAPRETSLIMAAATAGLPAALREHVAHGLDVETAISLTASSLAARTAFTPVACAWVATELAIALGLASPHVAIALPSPQGIDAEETGAPAVGAAPATAVAARAGTPTLEQSPAVSEAAALAQAQDAVAPVDPVPPTAPFTTPPGQAPRRAWRAGRTAPAALVGASIVVAGAVVAVAIVLGTRSSGSAAHHGSSGPPASSGSATPSTSASTPPSPSYRVTATLDPGTQGSMTQVAWTPDSLIVATSNKDGSTYLWDPATGRPHGRPLAVPGAGRVYSMAISSDGTTLAAGYSNGSTYLWDIANERLIATLPDPGPVAGKQVDSVAFSPDGHTLVSADGNGHAYVWRIPAAPQSPSPVRTLPDPVGSGVWSAVFSSNGMLATGDYSGYVYLWNIGTGSYQGPLVVPGGVPVTALAFSPQGNVIAAGSGSVSAGSGSMYLFSTVSQASRFIANPGPVWAMSFDGATLAAADGDGQAYLWDVNAASLTVTAAGTLADPNSGGEGVGALDFSPDGTWLVTGDTNGKAYVWRSG